MKIRIVVVGKTKNSHAAALCQDYLNRIRRFTRCELVVVKERDPRGILEEENALLQKLGQSAHSILLDVGGREVDTDGFTDVIEQHCLRGTKQLDFVVGGPWGWTDKVRAAANEHIALSRLTLPHELARVMLLEQVYRALSKIRGLPYDK